MDTDKTPPVEPHEATEEELEAYIKRNPYSSTLEKEQLQEKRKRRLENHRPAQKQEEILYEESAPAHVGTRGHHAKEKTDTTSSR